MSSRALRKAQKRAEEERLAALAAAPSKDTEEDDEGEEEEEETPVVSKKPNLFAMLEAELEDADEGEQDEKEDDAPEPSSISTPTPSKSKKNKKKKKKNKGKAKAVEEKEEEDDDFDSALAALKATTISSAPSSTPKSSPTALLNNLLHIDPRHLDLENEMRKLFGRSATRDSTPDTGARLPRGRIPVGAARPLTGRRNPFVQPGENWPRDSSGGLSMSLISKNEDGTIDFRYEHSPAYVSTQRQFSACVRSLDPDRMINHLSSNPYHISSLLQVSHIALTQSNDHTASQMLISRALFSLGRSSHSVFPTSLTSGIARLPFKYFENRELYFAAWKYVLSLSRRGLWRTGLEFLRLILQFSPESDPLCISLIIDQYALKSRSFDILLSLSSTPILSSVWENSPNILYSLALAHFMSNDLPSAKSTLLSAVKRFPWLAVKLHGSLSAEATAGKNLPQDLWGILPPSETDALLAEMYTTRMGDLWNIPENASFLLSTIVDAKDLKIDRSKIGSMKDVYVDEKMRDLARHVFLMDASESRSLIGFLPKALRDNQGYAWDILPPTGKESSYQKEMEAGGGAVSEERFTGGIRMGAGGIFEVFLRSLMPTFQAPEGEEQDADDTDPPRQIERTFEVGEDDLRATLATMVDEGVGFPGGMGVTDRAELALNVGLVPVELREWFGERFGVQVPDVPAVTGVPAQQEAEAQGQQATVEEEEESEEEEVQERDSRAIDRLVQILGTGDRASLRMRVDRMFEGQGAEMAEVKRRVEERLGLR